MLSISSCMVFSRVRSSVSLPNTRFNIRRGVMYACSSIRSLCFSNARELSSARYSFSSLAARSLPLLRPFAAFHCFSGTLRCMRTSSYWPLIVTRIRIGASPFFKSFVFKTKNRMFIVPCLMTLILMGLTSFFVKRRIYKLYICISLGQVGKVNRFNL